MSRSPFLIFPKRKYIPLLTTYRKIGTFLVGPPPDNEKDFAPFLGRHQKNEALPISVASRSSDNIPMTNGKTQISLVVDKAVKEKAYAILKEKGHKPSDIFRDVLEYITQHGEPPLKKALISDEDRELLAEAKRVLANPGKITKVPLHELTRI